MQVHLHPRTPGPYSECRRRSFPAGTGESLTPGASNQRLRKKTRDYSLRRTRPFPRLRKFTVTVCGRWIVLVVVRNRRHTDQKVNQNGEQRQRGQVTPAKLPVERRPLSHHELDVVHEIVDACKSSHVTLDHPLWGRMQKIWNVNCYRIPRRWRSSRTRLKTR